MGQLIHFYSTAASWRDHISGPEVTPLYTKEQTGNGQRVQVLCPTLPPKR
jgi:hypothetical protein